MPSLSNPRHEAFCQAYAITGNAAESWRQSGGTGDNADVNGSNWLVKTGFAERIEEIRNAAAQSVEKGKKDLVRWLCEVVDGRTEASTTQLKAAEMLNRMHGWNEPDKLDASVNMTPSERAAVFEEKLKNPAMLGHLIKKVIPLALSTDEGREMIERALGTQE